MTVPHAYENTVVNTYDASPGLVTKSFPLLLCNVPVSLTEHGMELKGLPNKNDIAGWFNPETGRIHFVNHKGEEVSLEV